MKTKKCKFCQTDIPVKAKVCPNCKRTLSSVNKGLLLFAFLVIVLSVYIIASSSVDDSISNTVSTESSTDSNKKSKEKTKDEYTALNKSGNIVNNVTLKVNNVEKTNRINLYNGTMYSQPDDKDAVFLVVNVTINNKSDNAQSLNMLYFNIIGPNGEEYVPTTIVGADEEYIIVDAINPNLKKTGNIAFQVPNDLNIKKSKLCYNKKGTFDSNHYFKLK